MAFGAAIGTGNQEAKKAHHCHAKLFRDALIVALKKAGAEADHLQDVADALAIQAMSGNVSCLIS